MTGELDERFWEDHYRRHAVHGSPSPSPQLMAETADLEPGVALEAGCGEGGNAVWLAERGWRVTAVDLSVTALERAREYAESVGGGPASRIDWVQADLTTWTPPSEVFDLVSAHYVHPTGRFDELVGRLAAAVARDGTLLVVGHGLADVHSRMHAPADVSFDAYEVASLLDRGRWHVEVAETRERENLHGVTLHDAVVRALRRPCPAAFDTVG